MACKAQSIYSLAPCRNVCQPLKPYYTPLPPKKVSLNLQHVLNLPEGRHKSWNGVQEFAFLSSSQRILMMLSEDHTLGAAPLGCKLCESRDSGWFSGVCGCDIAGT